MENYKKGTDSLVYAVCGSGKTEISLAVIQYAINCGEHVGFAVPRKDVVIELSSRLSSIFKNNSVVSVYGGHHKVLTGDIVVLTTHQLYKYKKYFSLIVLDEIDAFPFKDNPVLKRMFDDSLIGNYIMMSATPSTEIIETFTKEKNKAILRLDTRFHHHPLPLPSFYISRTWIRYIYLIKNMKRLLKDNKQIFVFAPTVEECENLYRFISLLFKNGACVHSRKKQRTKIIDDFRRKKYDFLITTSILERGVTVKDLQVIVFDSHHTIYDKGTLIQIAGRAGRKIDAPDGEVIFIAKRKTKDMEDAYRDINRSNKALQNML